VVDIVRFWKDLSEDQLQQVFKSTGNQSEKESSFNPLLRQQHLLSIVDWLENTAQEDPVILVFEEIQLADHLTLDFLKYLAFRTDAKYLSLWFTCEPSTQDFASLAAFLDFLKSQKFQQHLLHPMDEAGCRVLVKSMFPANCFPEQFFGKLHTESGGNLSHLKALLNSLVDRWLIRLHGELWDFVGELSDIEHSDSLDQLFVHRIHSIRGKTKEVAQILGVSRGALQLSMLSSILECSEGEVIQHLVPLVQNGWVSQFHRNGNAWIGFNHPGFCSAVTADLTRTQMKELHLKIVRYYQGQSEITDSKVQESLGYHWLKIGEADQVAKYCLPAGQAMLAGFDPYQARDYWREAVALLQKYPEHHAAMMTVLFSLAELQRDIGEHREAIQTFQQIRNHLDENNRSGQVRCLNQIALMQDRLGETADAKRHWLSCLELLKGETHESIGVIYGGLGWLAFREGDHEEAIGYCRRGLARMDRQEVSSQKAYLLNTLGTLCFYRGEIEDALKLWRNSLKLRQKLGQRKGISDLHNNIGAALNAIGKSKGAKWHWNQSLEISQQLGDVERTAGIYNNLGIQAYEQGRLLEATRYYQQAYNILNRMGAKRDMASTLNNLGEVALKRAEYLKAMDYWQQALEIGKELADKESQIEPLYQLGHLHLLLCEYEEAERKLKDSETMANQINATGSLGSIYELLARLALQSNKASEAKEFIDRSLEFLKRSGDQVKLARGFITEAQIAAALGSGEQMMRNLEQAEQLAKDTGEAHLIASSALLKLHHLLNSAEEGSEGDLPIQTLKEVMEQGASFPEILWQAHWMRGRFLKSKGRWKAASEAYLQSISILKQISRKLPEPHQSFYLKGQAQRQFRQEVIELKEIMNR
jgi:tetratricopeptide (TPR) repeat protein